MKKVQTYAHNRRKKRKKSHMPSVPRKFIYGFSSTAIVLLAAILSIAIFFKITEVNVNGDEVPYDTAEILNKSGIIMGENMYSINKFEIIRTLKQTFPYIDDVQIRRRLPSAINITLTVATPYACVVSDDTDVCLVINEDGKVLEIQPSEFALSTQLILIKGINITDLLTGSLLTENPQSSDKINAAFQVLQIAQKNDILTQISEIDVEKLYRIMLLFDNRLSINIGTNENIDRKLQMFCEVNKLLTSTDAGIVDVSLVTKARYIPENVTENIPE